MSPETEPILAILTEFLIKIGNRSLTVKKRSVWHMFTYYWVIMHSFYYLYLSVFVFLQLHKRDWKAAVKASRGHGHYISKRILVCIYICQAVCRNQRVIIIIIITTSTLYGQDRHCYRGSSKLIRSTNYFEIQIDLCFGVLHSKGEMSFAFSPYIGV